MRLKHTRRVTHESTSISRNSSSSERGDLVRPVQLVPDVVVPDDFAVGRIQKRNLEASEVEGAIGESLGVTLGLREHALRRLA